MSRVSRVSLILVGLLVLGVPAWSLCGAMGEWMHACAMTASHGMEDCAAEVALSAGCCDAGAVGSATDGVLNRPDENPGSPAPAAWALVSDAADLDASRLLLPDPAPPPRPAPYRLFSALLL